MGRPGDSSVVDLSGLFAIPGDEQFLRAAYQRVFGRECDPLGFVHFREMLRSHAPRQVVLNHLITSDEARQLGRRFVGLPEPKLLGRHWTYRGRGLWQYAQRAVTGRVRSLLHLILQATRIEHLEHKVDYLLQDLVARSDRISTKADQSLWTLSEKLDAYTGTLLQKQNHLRGEIAEQHRHFDETTQVLRHGLDANEIEARERSKELSRTVDLLIRRTESIESATGAVEAALLRLGDDAAARASELLRESSARDQWMIAKIETGTAAVRSSVETGTAAIQNMVERGTATIQNAVETRTQALQNSLETGTAAIQSTVQAGTAAIQGFVATGTAAIQATVDAKAVAIQNSVLRLSTGLAQNASAIQRVREEIGTAAEAQYRSNELLQDAFTGAITGAVNGAVESLSRVQSESTASLSAGIVSLSTNLGTQSTSLAALSSDLSLMSTNLSSQSTNLATQVADLASQSTNLNERVSALLERQAALLDRQSAMEAQQAELRRSVEAPRPKPPMVFQGGDNVLVSELDGFIVGVPGEEWRMAAYHAFRGPMEPGLLQAFDRALKPGMVVLDIGANIGVFTLHAARLVGLQGKIYSFEPAPRVYRILRDNVQVNGFLETGVIEFRQLAAWDRAGTARMVVYDGDSGHSTLFPGDREGHEIEVKTVALDQELKAQKRVDVVKIDAEGAEPKILRGMKRIIERNPEIVIFIEFAPVHLRRAGLEPAAFLDELASMRLSVRQVHDVTGELLPIDREQLSSIFSANLCLSRMTA